MRWGELTAEAPTQGDRKGTVCKGLWPEGEKLLPNPDDKSVLSQAGNKKLQLREANGYINFLRRNNSLKLMTRRLELP